MKKPIHADDPRLTAYVLDELNAEEKALVEEALRHQPELEEALTEIRMVTGLIESTLAQEEDPALSQEQKQRIRRGSPAKSRLLLGWQYWVPGLVAAGVLLFLVVPQYAPPMSDNGLGPQTMGRNGERSRSMPNANPPRQADTTRPASGETEPNRGRANDEKLSSLGYASQDRLTPSEARPDSQSQADQTGYRPPSPGNQRESSLSEQVDSREIASDGDDSAVAPPAPAPEPDMLVGGLVPNDSSVSTVSEEESVTRGKPRQEPKPVSEKSTGEGREPAFGAKRDSGPEEAMVVTKEFKDKNFEDAIGLSRNFEDKDPGKRSQPLSEFEATEELRVERDLEAPSTEDYDRIVENEFIKVEDDPLTTFSIDVDTASYANVRRFLNRGQLPPPDAVRIEEMINYFTYDDPEPSSGHPFAIHVEIADAPWQPGHRLMRLGLKAKSIPASERPAANLVFLLDVSGSMSSENKLPLLKQAMKMLVAQLSPKDRVAMVVYAGASGLVLPSTAGNAKNAIENALDRLDAGGSTNGGTGIELAYKVAAENFIEGGVNRVILATDGDFNVGVSDRGSLIRMIEEKAKTDVFLTVLGFGMGNYKDTVLEQLADKGNGNYAYIDQLNEAQKVLVDELLGTLVTVAKDVKIQIELNPNEVGSYRLIGYENRILAHRDFNDDTKDAGEMGAGHSLTVLYELVPAAYDNAANKVDPLKYQASTKLTGAAKTGELLTVKTRYKLPSQKRSTRFDLPVRDEGHSISESSDNLRFSAAVAAFGMALRGSKYLGEYGIEDLLELATGSSGYDPYGYRNEFIGLVQEARNLLGK